MAEMKIACMVLGSIGTNVYVAWNPETMKGWIVDPADQEQQILKALEKEGIKLEAVLLTHGHFDHIGAVDGIREALGIPVYAMEAEEALLENPNLNASALYGGGLSVKADRLLQDGQEFTIADIPIKALFTPGHTAGGCCYYCPENGILFSGDTLFRQSVGRSDLPTGNGRTLIESIKEKLMPLPDEVQVLPGHGGTSSIGYEREKNYFL